MNFMQNRNDSEKLSPFGYTWKVYAITINWEGHSHAKTQRLKFLFAEYFHWLQIRNDSVSEWEYEATCDVDVSVLFATYFSLMLFNLHRVNAIRVEQMRSERHTAIDSTDFPLVGVCFMCVNVKSASLNIVISLQYTKAITHYEQ